MKKFIALIFSLCIVLSLAACNKNAQAPVPDASGTQTEDPSVPVASDGSQEPEKTGWDELLDAAGFVSNETAYGMTRDEYHGLVGQPDISQETYYGDFQADIYYVGMESESARVIELDFELEGLSGASKPSMIRLSGLDGADLSDGSGIDILSSGTLGLTERFRNMSLDNLVSDPDWPLGEPMQSDPGKWGFATWYAGRNEISAYLDADGNILYFQARSVMDDALEAGDGQDVPLDGPVPEETAG